jgi:two-component system nitrate/nitrite sensor histidine kinase NarX
VNQDAPLSLSAKLGLLGILLFMVALVSIGVTLWVGWQLQGGAGAINEAGRLRMQTWRLAQALSMQYPKRPEVTELIKQFDDSLNLLQHGDPLRPLFVPHYPHCQQTLKVVLENWDVLRTKWNYASPPAASELAIEADAFVQKIDSFVLAIEQQLEAWTTLLNTFQFAIAAAVVASAIALIYAAWSLVLNPLSRLQGGVELIRKGDLAARIPVNSNNEFGALAQDFNLMAETLENFYRSLEDRVREKTLSLQIERERLTQLYQAVSLSVRANSFTELADGYARQLREVAHADACALRWHGDSAKNYLLVASDGLPSELANLENNVSADYCLCGQPHYPTKARLNVLSIPDKITASTHWALRACQSVGFTSLACIPIEQHDKKIGEIDLFYRGPFPLGQEDFALLEALTNHLVSAVEGMRVDALEREAAVAEERGFLARELHDSIAQNLTFQKIQTSLLREAIQRADTPAISRSLDELDTGIRESLADVRELLVHFRTRANAQDTLLALRSALTKFEHQTGLQTNLLVQGQGLPLPADHQVQVLHIVQEALSNVRKHAAAKTVWVTVERGLQQWRLEIRDDGRGFDTEHIMGDETRVGLRIMRERAQRIGAVVDISSAIGAGTRIVLTLPQTTQQAAT